MRRAIILASLLGGSVGVAWGCGESLDDLLLDALCDTDDDCAPGQKCIRTGYQATAGAQGWCRNDSSCSSGSQPGCECLLVGAEYQCDPTTELNITGSTSLEGCYCVFNCNTAVWPDNMGCPANLVADPGDGSSSDCKCVLP